MDRMTNKTQGPGEDDRGEPFKELRMPDARETHYEGRPIPEGLDAKTMKIISDFRERLGLPRGPGFRDDAESPPLDMALIRGYVDRTISFELQGEVMLRAIMYRPWSEVVSRLECVDLRRMAASDPEASDPERSS